MGQQQKAKFLMLIDQSKQLVGELNENEDIRESHEYFYNPGPAGADQVEVMNLDGGLNIMSTIDEENFEVIAGGKAHKMQLSEYDLMRANDETF